MIFHSSVFVINRDVCCLYFANSQIGPVSVSGAPARYRSQPQLDSGSIRNIAVAKWNDTR